MTVTIDNGGPLAAPLDGLKAYLRISQSDEDALLTDLIRAATDVAERFIGQLLIIREINEIVQPSPEWRALSIRPVTSIEDVRGVPLTGAPAALPVTAYGIDIDGNGDGWLRVHDAGGATRITVRYRAGMAADAAHLPDAIRHGIIRLAGDYHALREGVEPQPPASVAALWRPWRRMRIR